jgi:hypothetical protein
MGFVGVHTQTGEFFVVGGDQREPAPGECDHGEAARRGIEVSPSLGETGRGPAHHGVSPALVDEAVEPGKPGPRGDPVRHARPRGAVHREHRHGFDEVHGEGIRLIRGGVTEGQSNRLRPIRGSQPLDRGRGLGRHAGIVQRETSVSEDVAVTVCKSWSGNG